MKKEKLSPVIPQQNAEDVLETAEMLRAANCLMRCAVGIISMAPAIVDQEIDTQERLQEWSKACDIVFDRFRIYYAALMQRYSSLSAMEIGKDGNKVS